MQNIKQVLMVLALGMLTGCDGDGGGGGGVVINEKFNPANESIETLWVGHHQYWNPDDWPAPSLSLIVSNTLTPEFTLENMQTVRSISGFFYEQGYVYKVRVKKTKVINLSSVPVYNYSLLAVEDKWAAAGQTFDFSFPKTNQYRRNGTSITPLNLTVEFRCEMPVCEALDEIVARPNVVSVVLQAKVALPGEPMVFTAIKKINLTP